MIRNLVRRIIARKSTEEDRHGQAYLHLSPPCRGIVTLARRCLRGKVTTKARIVQPFTPVARTKAVVKILQDCF